MLHNPCPAHQQGCTEIKGTHDCVTRRTLLPWSHMSVGLCSGHLLRAEWGVQKAPTSPEPQGQRKQSHGSCQRAGVADGKWPLQCLRVYVPQNSNVGILTPTVFVFNSGLWECLRCEGGALVSWTSTSWKRFQRAPSPLLLGEGTVRSLHPRRGPSPHRLAPHPWTSSHQNCEKSVSGVYKPSRLFVSATRAD